MHALSAVAMLATLLAAGCVGDGNRAATAAEEAQARAAPELLAAALGPDGDLRWLNVTMTVSQAHGDGVVAFTVQGDLELLAGDAFRYTARVLAVTGEIPSGSRGDSAFHLNLQEMARQGIITTFTCTSNQVTREMGGQVKTEANSRSCLSHRPESPLSPLVGWGPSGPLVMPLRPWPSAFEFEQAEWEGESLEATFQMDASAGLHYKGPATATLEGGRIVRLEASLAEIARQTPADTTLRVQATFAYGPRAEA